jgi:hypothetical protein
MTDTEALRTNTQALQEATQKARKALLTKDSGAMLKALEDLTGAIETSVELNPPTTADSAPAAQAAEVLREVPKMSALNSKPDAPRTS